MIKKSWNNRILRGDRTLRAYRDHFNNHPYQKLVMALNDSWNPNECGAMWNQKRNHYGIKYSRYFNDRGDNMQTWSRNSAHYKAPEYSFYAWIKDVIIDEQVYTLNYHVNFYDNKYYVNIEPHFKFNYGIKKDIWKVDLPLSLKMNEQAIIDFATTEIRKVILRPGAMQATQIWLRKPISEFKAWLKENYGLRRSVSHELNNRNFDNNIIRRLRNKHNIKTSWDVNTKQLLDLLSRYRGQRLTNTTAAIPARHVYSHMQDFDGDVDEVESYIQEEFGNYILI